MKGGGYCCSCLLQQNKPSQSLVELNNSLLLFLLILWWFLPGMLSRKFALRMQLGLESSEGSTGLNLQGNFCTHISGALGLLHVTSLSSRVTWTSFLVVQGSKKQEAETSSSVKGEVYSQQSSLLQNSTGQSSNRPD